MAPGPFSTMVRIPKVRASIGIDSMGKKRLFKAFLSRRSKRLKGILAEEEIGGEDQPPGIRMPLRKKHSVKVEGGVQRIGGTGEFYPVILIALASIFPPSIWKAPIWGSAGSIKEISRISESG